MSRREGAPLSYYERKTFSDLTNGLGAEIEASMKPTDGWDTVPRLTPTEEAVDSSGQNQAFIPYGHIAFMGDFESTQQGSKES